MSLEISSLNFSYLSAPILRNVSFSADKGELIAVLGPNGVGKSTLFRCLLGFLKPSSGDIILDGQDIFDLKRARLARSIAYIPQAATPVFNYTVLESVLMGVTGSLGFFKSPDKEHTLAAERILGELGIAHLASRGCGKISGGERQLMLLARALIQDAKILIMDEPTANLDYGNSYLVMERVAKLAKMGYTILFSTHDPNQAFRHATRVLALMDGELIADGAPKAVLNEMTLSRLYGVDVKVRNVDVDGEIIPISIPFGNK